MTYVMDLTDLAPGQAHAAEVDGVPVAIVRAEDGTVHAIGEYCTHERISLADGEVEGRTIECWKHGSRFDLATGAPKSLPATKPVPVYVVQIDGDAILVDTTPQDGK